MKTIQEKMKIEYKKKIDKHPIRMLRKAIEHNDPYNLQSYAQAQVVKRYGKGKVKQVMTNVYTLLGAGDFCDFDHGESPQGAKW